MGFQAFNPFFIPKVKNLSGEEVIRYRIRQSFTALTFGISVSGLVTRRNGKDSALISDAHNKILTYRNTRSDYFHKIEGISYEDLEYIYQQATTALAKCDYQVQGPSLWGDFCHLFAKEQDLTYLNRLITSPMPELPMLEFHVPKRKWWRKLLSNKTAKGLPANEIQPAEEDSSSPFTTDFSSPFTTEERTKVSETPKTAKSGSWINRAYSRNFRRNEKTLGEEKSETQDNTIVDNPIEANAVVIGDSGNKAVISVDNSSDTSDLPGSSSESTVVTELRLLATKVDKLAEEARIAADQLATQTADAKSSIVKQLETNVKRLDRKFDEVQSQFSAAESKTEVVSETQLSLLEGIQSNTKAAVENRRSNPRNVSDMSFMAAERPARAIAPGFPEPYNGVLNLRGGWTDSSSKEKGSWQSHGHLYSSEPLLTNSHSHRSHGQGFLVVAGCLGCTYVILLLSNWLTILIFSDKEEWSDFLASFPNLLKGVSKAFSALGRFLGRREDDA